VTTVLHILDHSLPQQSGYATRGHSILRSLGELDLNVQALTSPKHQDDSYDDVHIDGVHYMRSNVDNAAPTSGVAGQIRTILGTRKAIRRYLRNNPVQLIHAHSPCLNGLATIGLDIPFVYEMRSSWEDAAVSEGATTEGSLRYRASRALETFVARRASGIVTICEGLKQELINRGIAQDRITVIPNAVPESMFEPPSATDTRELRDSLGLEGSRVIGYFGSFFHWEGVHVLVEAMPEILKSVPGAKLLLVGGGRFEGQLREQASGLGVDSSIIFTGRVPHTSMTAMYALANVMVFPRISNRLTEMVTPLKPLEAMAQRVPVVASNVGGHLELIKDGETGFLFEKGSVSAMVSRIVDALDTRVAVDEIVGRAYAEVAKMRRWSDVSRKYLDVYEKAQGDGHA